VNDAWGHENAEETGNMAAGTGNGLRQFAESMQKQNKELLDRLNQIEAERQREKFDSVFTTLGVPDAAKLYDGELDPEKAKAWVDNMRGVFGGAAQGETPAPVTYQPAVTDDQQAALVRMTEAGQNGIPMGNVEAAQAGVNGATDLQSLIAAFQNGMNRA